MSKLEALPLCVTWRLRGAGWTQFSHEFLAVLKGKMYFNGKSSRFGISGGGFETQLHDSIAVTVDKSRIISEFVSLAKAS